MSSFNNFIIAVLDIVLPLKLFSFRLLSKRSPWFDIDCISLKRIARKYERNYRTNKFSTSYDNYLRNFIVHAASSKNRWSLLSKLLHKNLPPPTSFSA